MKKEISAGGIVFRIINSNIEWLICQHSQHKGWVFPKGLVGDTDKEESLEVAALREVFEEGGVVAKIIAQLSTPIHYIYDWQGKPVGKTVHYFLMKYISGDPADHDHEMDEAKFVSEQEVRDTLTYQTDKDAYAEALKLMVVDKR